MYQPYVSAIHMFPSLQPPSHLPSKLDCCKLETCPGAVWSTVRVACHRPSGQTAAHLGPYGCARLPHLRFPACLQEEERWGEASNDEDDPKEKALPEDPETCLQLNMVYQEVVREKLAEVSLLLAQNREQQVRRAWPGRRCCPASGPGSRPPGEPLLADPPAALCVCCRRKSWATLWASRAPR